MISIEKQLQQDTFDPRLGRISLDKLLTVYRTRPNLLLSYSTYPYSAEKPYRNLLNDLQARIYLKYSVLMDPEKVKIFTYKTPSSNPAQAENAEKVYKQKLAAVAREMMRDWLFSGSKTAGERTRLEILFDLLKMR
jgi:hypothetical protein